MTQILLQQLGHSPALIGQYMGSTVVISSHQSAPWDSRLQLYLHLTTMRMAAPSLQSYLPALALFLVGVVRYWAMSKQAESLLNYPATLFIPSVLIAPSQQADSGNFRQQLSHSSGSPALFLLSPLLSTPTTTAKRYLTNLSQGSNQTGGLCPIKPSHSPILVTPSRTIAGSLLLSILTQRRSVCHKSSSPHHQSHPINSVPISGPRSINQRVRYRTRKTTNHLTTMPSMTMASHRSLHPTHPIHITWHQATASQLNTASIVLMQTQPSNLDPTL
jgi:hypothetical protein